MNKDMNKSSIEAAQEAIAKVNAMLIAKGKLKPSQLSNTGIKKPGIQSNIITRDVEINDVPIGCRNMLTRGATQEEISKLSGAAVATKGRYMTQEDKLRNPKDRPLYLYVQGTSPDAVNLAVGRINEIIANGMAKQGPRMSRFSARGSNHHTGHRQLVPLLPPNNPHENLVPMTLLQEKLYIGLEHAPPNFSVKDKIFGPGGAFLQHIQAETGAKVSLRGKGSGFIEPTGGELMEPMHVHLQHVNMNGLQQAKELATNLIQTVQQEYAAFQQSFVSVPPPNMGIQHQSMMVPPPQIVSLAQPPPLLPGQQIITSMPPPQQMIQQPQSTYLGPPPPATMTVSLPAPGVVIPQLATSMAPVMQNQPQPGQLIQQSPPMQTYVQHSIGQPGQPVQQYIQSSEQQIIGGQFVSQPQVVVSLSPGQQPGQVIYSTVGGQPLQHPVQLQQPPPQQLMTAQGVQIQQSQIYQQPGQILQQPPPQQQLQQQFAYQQQQQQQQLIQQGQQTIISGTPRYIQQPIGQTTIQQLVPSGTVQLATALPPAPLGQQPAPQPVQPVSWGGSAQSVPGSVYSTMQQYSQSGGDSVMSVSQSQPGLVMSSSTASNTTPSGYVYKTGPVEEPKRRFTEEKQEDKVPEGLLGYEHGPPHLTNLMVQPGQPQQPQPPSSQQQQLTQVGPDAAQQQPQQQQQLMYGQQIIQSQPTELQQPLPQPQQVLYSQVVQQQPGLQQQQPQQQYTIVSQQQQPQYYQQQQQQMYQQQQQQYQNQQLQQNQLQQQQNQQLQQQYNQQYQQQQQQSQQIPQIQEQARVEGDTQGQTTVQGELKGEDKLLMPPPPPPGELVPGVSNLKRQSPGLTPQSAPEPRKKRFHDDDDDADIPSSMASQAKELKKFSFNQYSSTPQLYTNQTTTTYSQYGSAQNGSPSPGQDQYQPDSTYQQQQYQQDPQNTSHYGITSTGQTYSQYSVATSSSYSPPASSTQHQPPPPPPPLYEDQSSRSPESRSKGFNPQFISTFSREENNVLRQPPPPPPPPGGRSRTYW